MNIKVGSFVKILDNETDAKTNYFGKVGEVIHKYNLELVKIKFKDTQEAIYSINQIVLV